MGRLYREIELVEVSWTSHKIMYRVTRQSEAFEGAGEREYSLAAGRIVICHPGPVVHSRVILGGYDAGRLGPNWDLWVRVVFKTHQSHVA